MQQPKTKAYPPQKDKDGKQIFNQEEHDEMIKAGYRYEGDGCYVNISKEGYIGL